MGTNGEVARYWIGLDGVVFAGPFVQHIDTVQFRIALLMDNDVGPDRVIIVRADDVSAAQQKVTAWFDQLEARALLAETEGEDE